MNMAGRLSSISTVCLLLAHRMMLSHLSNPVTIAEYGWGTLLNDFYITYTANRKKLPYLKQYCSYSRTWWMDFTEQFIQHIYSCGRKFLCPTKQCDAKTEHRNKDYPARRSLIQTLPHKPASNTFISTTAMRQKYYMPQPLTCIFSGWNTVCYRKR